MKLEHLSYLPLYGSLLREDVVLFMQLAKSLSCLKTAMMNNYCKQMIVNG